MGRNLKIIAVVSLGCSVSACGLYLHDERLVTPATTAEASLASANTTAPFDAQLAHLAAFADEENLTVARYRVAERDDRFARLIAGDFKRPSLVTLVDERIEELAPAADDRGDLVAAIRLGEANRRRIIEQRAQSLRLVANERENYLATMERLKVTDAEQRATKAGCEDVRSSIAEADVDQATASGDEVQRALGNLAKQCWIVEGQTAEIKQIDARVGSAGGLLAKVAGQLAEAEGQTDPDLSAVAADLQAQIKKAEVASKSAEKRSLENLADDIGQVLDSVGQAARLAGWEKVDTAVAKLIRAQVCNASEGSIEAETLEEAECDEVDPASTTGKASATGAFAEALSQLLQSNDKNLRTTQWLLAAKAIVAAEKASAKLEVEQARQTAAARRSQLSAYIEETYSLGYARRALATGSSPGCAGTRESCAFAAYVTAWNRGRIPAEVLTYHPIQIDREFAVRRAKAVAEKQRALALVGAGTLKAGAEGGIKPELLAQLLLDLTLIGVTAEN